MANKKLKAKRNALWLSNPRCENCGVVTILPESVPGAYVENGFLKMDITPDNMATVQHKYCKNHPLRHTRPVDNERRQFLWCAKCNREYNIKYENPLFKSNGTNT